MCIRMQLVATKPEKRKMHSSTCPITLKMALKISNPFRMMLDNDWKKYSPAQKILIGRTAQIARLIRALSEVRFLNDDATLRPEIQESVDAAEELLDELGA